MILIITYDLKTPKDYHQFYESIKAQGEEGKWWHYMAATWLLSTTKTPQQVVEAIHHHLDKQDLLFVCELSPRYQGLLPKPAWDWINSELKPLDYASLFAGLAGGIPPAPNSTPDPIVGALGRITPPPKPK